MTTKEQHEPCKARYPADEACLVERNGRVKGRGVCAFTASFPSADVENMSLLCVVAEVCACMLIEQKLACSQISWPV